jgi:hypothetical protein
MPERPAKWALLRVQRMGIQTWRNQLHELRKLIQPRGTRIRILGGLPTKAEEAEMMAKVPLRDDVLPGSVARSPDGTIVMAKDKSIGETVEALRVAGIRTGEVSVALRTEVRKPYWRR